MNATKTISDIVSGDFRAAAVFERHGIDFCCGGNRTVEQACAEKNLNAEQVLSEVSSVCASPDANALQFAAWDPSALVSYIVSKHHAYVRAALPPISAYTQKLAKVHGENHPELLEVAQLFDEVAAEMTSHMFKEEQILFPYISSLESAVAAGGPKPPCPFGTVSNPIRMMEHEHDSAGNAMARIRELTNGYQLPADGCTTYQVGLQELQAFEQDLHTHVHLENNILFPKALELERRG